jgi:hypothetical protein
MATIGRTGDPLEGTFQVPQNYPDPAGQNVNSLPMDFAYDPNSNYLLDTTAPSVPSGVSSPSHTATTVVLSWGASTDRLGVDHYNIYIGTTLSGSTKNLTATISGLVSATPYNFKVTAVDKHGNESAKSSNVAVTTS